jgi:hypothetical protein
LRFIPFHPIPLGEIPARRQCWYSRASSSLFGGAYENT